MKGAERVRRARADRVVLRELHDADVARHVVDAAPVHDQKRRVEIGERRRVVVLAGLVVHELIPFVELAPERDEEREYRAFAPETRARDPREVVAQDVVVGTPSGVRDVARPGADNFARRMIVAQHAPIVEALLRVGCDDDLVTLADGDGDGHAWRGTLARRWAAIKQPTRRRAIDGGTPSGAPPLKAVCRGNFLLDTGGALWLKLTTVSSDHSHVGLP
ncbi:MAG: hypothetical protein E6J72_20345 [Deltaproteobacteria bacterium]|nr:MAG: hypothetical protein E6J72_20345 [Deltaproteobacteria bacterium]